jgi:anti-sigma factor RsiW
MNGHPETWIEAYLDQELTEQQKKQFEKHLAACQPCRELLAERRALSALLAEVPPAEGLKPARQFTAEVRLRMPHHWQAGQDQPQMPAQVRDRARQAAWFFVPISLILAFVFSQTVSVLSILLRIIPGAGQALIQQVTERQAGLSLPPLRGALGGWNLPSADLLGWLGVFTFWDWDVLFSAVAALFIGLLYAAWLAGWWANHQDQASSE